MGLFSSKKKTSVGTSVVRAIDDIYIPDSVRDAAFDSIINDNNFAESLQGSLLSSVALRSNRYYKYGKDGYVFGSPSAEYLFSTHGINDVSEALADLEGDTVSILFYRVGDYNLEHYLKAELLNWHSYDKAANELTLYGEKYIITDVLIMIPPALSYEYSDAQLERMEYDTYSWFNTANRVALVNKVRISIEPTSSNRVEAWAGILPFDPNGWYWGDPTYEQLPISFPESSNENEEADFISVVYKVGQSAETTYFVYKVGGGLHPKLDNITNLEYKQEEAGQFYPNGYYRIGKENVINWSESTASSLKKLHKYIGLDYEEINDNIHSDAENVKDVEQAYLFAGVPALPEYDDPSVNEYLFKFFEQLHSNKYTVDKESSGDIHVSLSNPAGYGSVNAHQLTNTLFRMTGHSRNVVFALVDNYFSLSFNMDSIERVILAGKVAEKGEYAVPSVGSTYYTGTHLVQIAGEDSPREYTYKIPIYYIKYQYQISNNTYIEYQVFSPTMVQNIYGGHATTATINNETPNLLVPIDRAILSNMPLTKREKVFSYGLNFVFNSRVTQKVKWYQRGIFKVFMTVVAVAITIWSQGGLAGIAAKLSAATAAVTTATIFSLFKALATKLLISIAIMEGVKLGTKLFGESFAIIAAVVTAAAAIYGAATKASWTKNMISVTSNIVQGGNRVIQDKFAALQQDFDDFVSYAESKTDELNELLQTINASNRGHYLAPILLAGESPNAFYNRTINSVGRSDLPFVSLNTYYDRALTLPTVAETLSLNTHV